MGCGSCLMAKSGASPYYTAHIYTGEDCRYTFEMMVDWKDKLFCARDGDKLPELGLTKQQLNSYIGIVLSAINMKDSLCAIASKIDTVEPTIVKIINLGIC